MMLDDGPKANPLIGDRLALERECLQLVRQRAEETGRDAVEIIAEASEHKGRAKLNPASMTDDRLLHTVLALRKSAQKPAEANGYLHGAPEWINARGGPVRAVEGFLEWHRENVREGESDQNAFKRWANGCPAGTYALLGERIYHARRVLDGK